MRRAIGVGRWGCSRRWRWYSMRWKSIRGEPGRGAGGGSTSECWTAASPLTRWSSTASSSTSSPPSLRATVLLCSHTMCSRPSTQPTTFPPHARISRDCTARRQWRRSESACGRRVRVTVLTSSCRTREKCSSRRATGTSPLSVRAPTLHLFTFPPTLGQREGRLLLASHVTANIYLLWGCAGGYHPGRDMVLILDTARFKYPPHWCATGTSAFSHSSLTHSHLCT